MDGIKEWLVTHAITPQSVCAATKFALKCVDDACEGLLKACKRLTSLCLRVIPESALKGISFEAAKEVLKVKYYVCMYVCVCVCMYVRSLRLCLRVIPESALEGVSFEAATEVLPE